MLLFTNGAYSDMCLIFANEKLTLQFHAREIPDYCEFRKF